MEAHASCPGARRPYRHRWRSGLHLPAPQGVGHRVHGYFHHLSQAEAAANEAEDARREELRVQWEVATTARLSFLRELTTKGEPPAKLVRTLTEMLCLHP